MDVFILVMGFTLAAAGWFLYKDYARFLASGYFIRGELIGLERPPALRSGIHSEPFSHSGLLPIIRYTHRGEWVSFTAMDAEISSNYQVGDEIPLKVVRSRRQRERLCRSSKVLLVLLVLLASTLISKAFLPVAFESLIQVCLASVVLTLGVVLMVPYCRERDGDISMKSFGGSGVRQIFKLQEPAAYSHWEAMLDNLGQKKRIASVRLFGLSCLALGMIISVIGASGQVRAAASSLATIGLNL